MRNVGWFSEADRKAVNWKLNNILTTTNRSGSIKGEHHGSSFLLQQTSAGLFAGSDWSQQTVLQIHSPWGRWIMLTFAPLFTPPGWKLTRRRGMWRFLLHYRSFTDQLNLPSAFSLEHHTCGNAVHVNQIQPNQDKCESFEQILVSKLQVWWKLCVC